RGAGNRLAGGGGGGARGRGVVGRGDVGIRPAAVDGAARGARLVVVEPDALGALLGHDVEDVVGDGGMHGAVGRLPLHASLVDGGVGALGLAGPAVDALAGDDGRHAPDEYRPGAPHSNPRLAASDAGFALDELADLR